MRQDAEAILRAALQAVEPESLVLRALHRHADLWTGGLKPSIIAFGKAAAAMARGASRVIEQPDLSGVVITPQGSESRAGSGFACFGGGHPLPNAASLAGARAVLDLARAAGAEDLLIVLVSGGGSSMMALPPPGVSLADLRRLTRLLLRAGLPIADLNSIRKRIDLLKGGRLARAAHPARVLALMISDVVGDAPQLIASGPLHADRSPPGEARAVLEQHGLLDRIPRSILAYLRDDALPDDLRPPAPDDPCFEHVTAEIIGNGRTAAQGAALEARRRGYQTLTVSTALCGEARHVGRFLADGALRIRHRADPIAAPACIIAAGETTVTLHGDGVGGRNQEVALGAAQELAGAEGILLASIGTDGIDGPTGAAGALATGSTLRRAAEARLDYREALERNNAYPFFKQLGDLIVTGPTGTNVADLQIVLVQ